MTASEPDDTTWRANASANLLKAAKKRGRLGTKKTRTGCLSCKSRRVKCDEQQPICRRCSSSGRECSYAGSSNSTSPGSDASSAVSFSSGSTSLIGRQMSGSHSIGLRDQDRRTFDYFLSWTAPHMAGFMDQDFWCGQVLVLAQTEPVILDGILALSVLYEHPQFMKSFFATGAHGEYESPNHHPSLAKKEVPIDANHSLALRHYNRSLKRLQQKAASGQISSALALLSCVIFIAIEIIRDNIFAARELVNHGVQLLRSLGSRPEAVNERLFLSVKQTMTRLGVLAAVYGHTEPLRILKDGNDASRSQAFTTLPGARNALYEIMAEAYAVLPDTFDMPQELLRGGAVSHATTSLQSPSDLADADAAIRLHYRSVGLNSLDFQTKGHVGETVSLSSLPPAPTDLTLERIQILTNRLLHWRSKFNDLPDTESEAAHNILMLYLVSLIAISTWLSPFQQAYDQCTPDFREIIRLTENCYPEQVPQKVTEQPTFTFEMGPIGPLYYVATKCRVPSIRRDAIRLMGRGPRKESTFGSKSVAEVARRIVAIEEEGLESLDDTILPAEEKRVHGYEILINRPAGRYDLRVTRCCPGLDGFRLKIVKDYPI